MFVLLPGQVSTPRNLFVLVKEAYEAKRKSHNDGIVERGENGVEDTSTDWRGSLRGVSLELAALIDDSPQAFSRASALVLAVQARAIAGASPVEMPPFDEVANAGYKDVQVRFRQLTARMTREYWASDSDEEGDRAFASKVIAEVSGLRGPDGDIALRADDITDGGSKEMAEDLLDILDAAGIMTIVTTLGLQFQGLSGEKKEHFGQPVPETSPRSIAKPAA